MRKEEAAAVRETEEHMRLLLRPAATPEELLRGAARMAIIAKLCKGERHTDEHAAFAEQLMYALRERAIYNVTVR